MSKKIIFSGTILLIVSLFSSGCFNAVTKQPDYSAFRKSQMIVIRMPETVKRGKGLLVLAPEYLNQAPSDEGAIEYFKNKTIEQLHSFGYMNIRLVNNDTLQAWRNKKDTLATLVVLGEIDLSETKSRETQIEPTSKTEETITLKCISSDVRGTAETSRPVKERQKSQKIYSQNSQTETYTGKWEYSVGLIGALTGKSESWRYKYSVAPLSNEVIYTLLDESAFNITKEIDRYILFVNRPLLK